jgi:tape measure domain-containing protein
MPLVIQVKADTAQADASITKLGEHVETVGKKADQSRDAMGRFTRETSSSAERAKQSFGGLQKQLDGVAKSATDVGGLMKSAFTQVLGAAGIEASISGIISGLQGWRQATIELADAQIMLDNRLRLVSDNEFHRQVLREQLYDISNQAGAKADATIETYVRLKQATESVGLSEQRATAITDTLTKSMALGGKTAAEQASAQLQLSQALASGVLQGDEYRSLRETAPDLIAAFARELHVSTGELKKLSEQGKITTDVMVAGIEHMADDVELKFGGAVRTAQQRMQQLQNEIARDPGQFQRDINSSRGANPFGVAINAASDWATLAGLQEFEPGVKVMEEANAQFLNMIGNAKSLHDELDAITGNRGKDRWTVTSEGVTSVEDSINRMIEASKRLADPSATTTAQRQFFGLLHGLNDLAVDAIDRVDALGDAMDKLARKSASASGMVGNAIGEYTRKMLGVDGTWRTDADIAKAMGAHHTAHVAKVTTSSWGDTGSAPIVPPGIANMFGGGGGWPTLSDLNDLIGAGKEYLRVSGQFDDTVTPWDDLNDALKEGVGWLGKMVGLDPWDKEKLERQAKALEMTREWNREADGVANARTSAYGDYMMRSGNAGYGASAAFHEFTDDAMNSAKVVQKAFETGFKGAEDALVHFVETGRLSLSSLAHDLEEMMIRMLFRQAVGGIFGSGGGGGAVGAGAAGASPEQIAAGSSSARARPQEIHLHIGDDAAVAMISRPAVQSVIYQQQGAAMAVRARIKSRG